MSPVCPASSPWTAPSAVAGPDLGERQKKGTMLYPVSLLLDGFLHDIPAQRICSLGPRAHLPPGLSGPQASALAIPPISWPLATQRPLDAAQCQAPPSSSLH